MPRLTDAQSALQMMTTGQSLTGARAKAMGLVHQVVEPDQLVATAKQMIKDGLKPVAPWDEKGLQGPWRRHLDACRSPAVACRSRHPAS